MNTVLSTQFFCDPKIVLNSKVNQKGSDFFFLSTTYSQQLLNLS